MKNVKNCCVSRLVYNLTKQRVVCYNVEGYFIELEPVEFLNAPAYEHGICYIVPEEDYKRAKTIGRNTRDLVRIKKECGETGRGGIKIVYLETYDEDFTGEKLQVAPSSMRSYEQNEPKGVAHHFLKD